MPIQQKYIPGLGLTRSYEGSVGETTPMPRTAPQTNEGASFNKSLYGTDLTQQVAAEVKHKLSKGEDEPDGHSHSGVFHPDPLTDDDDTDSIDGQKGNDEMAEPNSERTDDLKPNASKPEAEMAQPNSTRTPKVKPSDEPKAPTHPGMTTREKSEVAEPEIVLYDRESRVYVTKSAVAGSIRRVVVNDGAPEYVVALDNGNTQRVAHADLQLMTREAATRQNVPPMR